MSIEVTSQHDQWVKCISTSGTLRAVAVNATEVSNILAQRHSLSGAPARALSEGIVAGLLLSSYCKSGEKVNLNIQGSGWCHQAIIDANAEAEVRGYVLPRDPHSIQLEKSMGPWGIGLLSVLRTKHDEAQPYIGTVPLLTGHLAKDLTFYWHQSEQVQSAVGILAKLTDDGKIASSEGFLIQAMPGATDEELSQIEATLKTVNEGLQTASNVGRPIERIARLLEHSSFNVLEEKFLTLKCPCSLDRVKRSLALIGKSELGEMKKEEKDFEIHCDFCSEKYVFTPSMIESLMNA